MARETAGWICTSLNFMEHEGHFLIQEIDKLFDLIPNGKVICLCSLLKSLLIDSNLRIWGAFPNTMSLPGPER